MTKLSFKLSLALWLAVNFLATSTILAGTIARHAQHHGHDQQSHSHTWCGWMCAAGQAIEAPSIHVAQSLEPMGWAFSLLPSFIPLIFAFSPGSRDPPPTTF